MLQGEDFKNRKKFAKTVQKQEQGRVLFTQCVWKGCIWNVVAASLKPRANSKRHDFFTLWCYQTLVDHSWPSKCYPGWFITLEPSCKSLSVWCKVTHRASDWSIYRPDGLGAYMFLSNHKTFQIICQEYLTKANFYNSSKNLISGTLRVPWTAYMNWM